ncbi:MAG: hypothetical protein ACK5MI_09280 [Mangrovibacterium sp.]
MKNLTFVYNDRENFYQIKWEGVTKIEDIQRAWNKVLDEFDLQGGKHSFLVDNSEVHYDETTSRCLELAQFYNNTDIFGDSRIAMVATTPHSTARLFYIVKNLKGVEMKVFSTLSAAKEWLM